MKSIVHLLVAMLPLAALAQGSVSTYTATAQKLHSTIMRDSLCYNTVAEFCDRFGHRLSGSESLEQSIDWVIAKLRIDGFANAHKEEVMVPHWVRGKESITMITPRKADVPMLGLGGSVGTATEGITAPVMIVHSFDELKKRGTEAKGKIVLFNVPFTTYGPTVQYRVNGAVEAARFGAVASLVRSVTPYSIRSPHTGMLRYNDSLPKIPHAAITVEDAEMFERMIRRGETVQLTIHMEAQTLPDARSHNVVFEIPGKELPNEVVVMGGHIDSWDVGQGAMDDAGGCFAAWRALKAMQQLGLQPKRTIRVVFWTNEENGVKGGAAYAKAHAKEKHVLAIESDEGTFAPKGFSIGANQAWRKLIEEVSTLLTPIQATATPDGDGGADIGALYEQGVPVLSLEVENSKYFHYHHTHGDTVDKLNPDELNKCATALAIMSFVVADYPTLPVNTKR